MTPTDIVVYLGGGFSLLWGISFWLIKSKITDVLGEVKRMGTLVRKEWYEEIDKRVKELPGRQWFNEVHARLQSLPDSNRLDDHFKRVHELGSKMQSLFSDVGNLKAEISDLKVVLRQTVDRASRNEGRLDAMDRSVGSRRNTDGGG